MAFAVKIEPNKKVDLSKYKEDADGGLSKEKGVKRTEELVVEMAELQDLLFEAGTHSMLIVLQGRDTSGKDGTIRFLLDSINVQGCKVAPFKVPSLVELAHDFLWRCHAVTPAKGGVTLFNRSHYEDVLVVRVHDIAPKEVWSKRFDHINAWEKLLVDSNTIVVKFFLHLSKDEQEKRLLAREKDVEKAWKLSVGDWKEREFWDSYTEAYEEVLARCSTQDAPWHLVSADHKWYRNLVVAEVIVEALRPYKAAWLEALKRVGDQAKLDIAEFRKV